MPDLGSESAVLAGRDEGHRAVDETVGDLVERAYPHVALEALAAGGDDREVARRVRVEGAYVAAAVQRGLVAAR
ncbi:hypothetical protein [Streptomyces sp. AHA2]|uniref:hypothetical protein n=1 Tax=Streptomyces sp. AHA2 TaxID=3064526 RepID=UPI002FE3E84E